MSIARAKKEVTTPKNFDVQNVANQALDRLNHHINANKSKIIDVDYDTATPINMDLSRMFEFSKGKTDNYSRPRITFQSNNYKVTIYDNWNALCRLLIKLNFDVKTGTAKQPAFKSVTPKGYTLPSERIAHIELCEYLIELDVNGNQSNLDYEMALTLYKLNNENLCLVRKDGKLCLAVENNGRGYIPKATIPSYFINKEVHYSYGGMEKKYYAIDTTMSVIDFINNQLIEPVESTANHAKTMNDTTPLKLNALIYQ